MKEIPDQLIGYDSPKDSVKVKSQWPHPRTCYGNVSGDSPLRIDFTTRIVSTLDSEFLVTARREKEENWKRIDKIVATS